MSVPTPADTSPQQASERVLSTLNPDGSRRWLRPRVSPGRFLNARRIVGYLLMLLFTALPYIKIGGKPAILLDVPRREFTFFGTTFLPTDTLLLALLLLTIFIGIFLLTALVGRVWCGWGCPQTVYLELLYRPIERLFEGRHYRTEGRHQIHPLRKVGKYVVFFLVSFYLAHTFLAYFVGVDQLAQWVRQSPLEHPASFTIMAITTLLMLANFGYMREQVCTLMCPYGRFQSVLLDRQSLIIGYDSQRGEPRSKRRKGDGEAELGDCIDCGLCVATCPTGIDIRDGLQMECVNCAQCIDACDQIMDKVGRPRGLIRYSSQDAMEQGRVRLFRPRVVIYPVLLVAVVVAFSLSLAGREPAHVSILRNRNMTYRLLDSGGVSNVLLVKVQNRTDAERAYTFRIDDPEARLSTSDTPLVVAPGQSGSATVHVDVPRDRFVRGRAEVELVVESDAGFTKVYRQNVLGPLFGGAAEGAGAGADAGAGRGGGS